VGKQRELAKARALMLRRRTGEWARGEGRERERAHWESIAAEGHARQAFRVATKRVLGPLAREGAVCEGCTLGVDPCADRLSCACLQVPTQLVHFAPQVLFQ
jgi:hypothetical protein